MKDKINILYTIPNFKTAGSQFVLLELYKRIDRTIFQPSVLVEKYPTIFPDVISLEERLFITTDVGKRSYISKLAKKLKEKSIDILHSWDYKSNSIEALACKKAGVAYLYTKKNNAWSKRWFAKSVLSSNIAYNNPEMGKRFFSHWIFKRKAYFVPHGLDVELFKPLAVKRVSGRFTIGCIGVIGDNKNQLLLLQALKELPIHTQVVCYGKEDAAYKKVLEEYIKVNNLEDQVSFNGYVQNSDIPKVMSKFDVLVLASKNEGLPLSIIEAMACGVPVLSSNSGGGARYLLEKNQGGFIFETKEELVAQTLQLQNNEELRTQIGKSGRKRVEEHFNISKEVASYKKLYLDLVGANG